MFLSRSSKGCTIKAGKRCSLFTCSLSLFASQEQKQACQIKRLLVLDLCLFAALVLGIIGVILVPRFF